MKIAVLGPVTKDYIRIHGEVSMHIGGIPYYSASTLKSLEADVTAFIAHSKEDTDWVLENFGDIDVHSIYVETTFESHIEYSPASTDTRIWTAGEKHKGKTHLYKNTIRKEQALLDSLNEFDYIVFGPLLHSSIDPRLFTALSHKKLVLGNCGMFTHEEAGIFVRKNPQAVLDILSTLEYLFLDMEETMFVSGEKTLKSAAQFLKEEGLKNLVVTEGSKGSHVFADGSYFKIPVFPPTTLVDATGAGDTYTAAYIRALELYDQPEDRGKFASMVASMSLEDHGAFRGTIDDVMKRIDSI